jgi:hypothetical protein
MIRLRTSLIALRRPSPLVPVVFLLAAALFASHLFAQTRWSAVGPDGGDARSFAAVPGQPNHIYLGITHGWVYESFDKGATWHRLALLDPTETLVVDNIVVDAVPILSASGPPDGSRTSPRAAAFGSASTEASSGRPSRRFKANRSSPLPRPRRTRGVLYAGTSPRRLSLQRTPAPIGNSSARPAAKRFTRSNPSPSTPPTPTSSTQEPGTCPGRPTTAARTWKNIKEGVIEDSDVFSIIIDPVRPRTVFLSACSGIYKSENAGASSTRSRAFRPPRAAPASSCRTPPIAKSSTPEPPKAFTRLKTVAATSSR